MIEIKNLFAGYAANEVLHGVSADFLDNKITVLLGPNGNGKSTLMKSVIKMTNLLSGDIFVDGQSVKHMNQQQIAKHVAYLAQSKHIPEISVERMVLSGRFAHKSYPKIYNSEDIGIVNEIISMLDLEDIREKSMKELSGGMQQKVYIAAAFAQQAKNVLLDEPVSFLDVTHQLKLMQLVKELANKGKAVVMVMHDIPLAMQYADMILLLNEGKVLYSGTPDEIYEKKYIDEVFGVKLTRASTEVGYRFFCT